MRVGLVLDLASHHHCPESPPANTVTARRLDRRRRARQPCPEPERKRGLGGSNLPHAGEIASSSRLRRGSSQ